jgi:NADH dehydrogenase FAD-containing subunit
MTLTRRNFVAAGAGAAVLGLSACASSSGTGKAAPRVVVVGGGFGGATAAKHVSMWGEGKIEVVMIEPQSAFISCPISNLVLGGSKSMADITLTYDNLARRHGVKLVRDTVARIDPAKKEVTLAGGGVLGYDKLIVSPGIDLNFASIEGLA